MPSKDWIALAAAEANTLWQLLDIRAQMNAYLPATTLPPEILCEIFRHAGGPLVLSRVCKFWRTVALQDQVLWSTIDSIHPEEYPLFLNRSGKRPLNLRVYQSRELVIPDEQAWCDTVAALNSRFVDVEVKLASTTMALFLTVIRDNQWESLESLKLSFSDGFTRRPNPTHLRVRFADTPPPNLRHLHLHRIINPRYEAISSADFFANLWTLELVDTGMQTSALLNLLQQCSSLQSFTLAGNLNRDRWMDPAQRIDLPHLRELRIVDIDPYQHNLPHILPMLLMPCLSLLKLTLKYPSERSITNSLWGPLIMLPTKPSYENVLRVVTVVELVMHGSESMRLVAYRHTSQEQNHPFVDVTVDVAHDPHGRAGSCHHNFRQLGRRFRRSELTALKVGIHLQRISLEDWYWVLSDLTQLRTLQCDNPLPPHMPDIFLGEDSILPLLQSLAPPQRGYDGPLIAPKLGLLVLGFLEQTVVSHLEIALNACGKSRREVGNPDFHIVLKDTRA